MEKEEIEEIKKEDKDILEMEERIENRKFKELTVGFLKSQNLTPFDVINVKKMFPIDGPFNISWEQTVSLHNAASDDGILITDDTHYKRALEMLVSFVKKSFLE